MKMIEYQSNNYMQNNRLFLNKDQNEIELYFTSDLIKKVVSGGSSVGG